MNSEVDAMAKLRSVNTHFWHDQYIGDCTPNEKLLFLYLLTCPLCNIAGAYEITVRQMAFDTGLPTDLVYGILGKFGKDNKVRYVNNYVLLVNHHKNQKLNANMERARLAIIRDLPPPVLKAFQSLPKASEAFESITEPLGTVTESFLQDKDKDKDKDKESVKERAQKFRATVFSEANLSKYNSAMLEAFTTYWTEPNRSGTKMLYEMKPTWSLAGRLATWASRERGGKAQSHTGDRIYRE
jgi:hypothetical protein